MIVYLLDRLNKKNNKRFSLFFLYCGGCVVKLIETNGVF